ncbi:acetyl-CoA synthetase-like protein [Polychaeton citri CBS 116435]|uniref:Acetyl-CoA synthetase-like protein n=1 Tax=Polychaeton citri CBS 116435 TaxID=1314669 RepID=A0A9P4Q156_9PEZI|nr:acetyl-CoA synthetase-like protein [Polychaeton citri CBS 116435]
MAQLHRSPFFEALASHDPQQLAVIHSLSGRSFTYGSLLNDVSEAKERLLQTTSKNESGIAGERVAFIVENSYDYVVTLLSILASNAIAVPLAPSFPLSELRYILDHSEALLLLTSNKYATKAQDVVKEELQKKPLLATVPKIEEGSPSTAPIKLARESDSEQGGLMLYTSGTTSRPKGVLLPQQSLVAQCRSLLEAWKYSTNDRLLHVLPLHHIHGTVNALLTPLFAGSTIELMFPFNVDHVWNRFAAPFIHKYQTNNTNGVNGVAERVLPVQPITFFTVVPTIWARMLQTHSSLPTDVQLASQEAIQRKNLRLNISGSAALPTPTKQAWTILSSGNILLERFGMTEVGMALSCGLEDEDRIDGSVGWPLPGVQARLVDTDDGSIIPVSEELDASGRERQGEIQLKGPTIFSEYWRNPEATTKEFTPDRWFKTGDIAFRKTVTGAGKGSSGSWATGPAYFIQGRKSADIIKTGGEKVSALEIERELLSLPEVSECAVVGLPSEAWGQKAAAVIVLSEAGKAGGKGGKAWSALDMRRALKDRLVAYKIPQDMKLVESIPRNAMGKINKKELVSAVFGDGNMIRKRSIDVKAERDASKSNGQ